MRNPCNRAVFEHFGQGTQLTLHDYSAERLESVLMEFFAGFAEKRSILFSAFAEIKAGQKVDTESYLGETLGKLYTKNRRVRVDEFDEVVGEVDRHLSAIRGRVEGYGRLLLLELAQYFMLASEKFGLVDRALGTDPVSERGSFAELTLCLWDATMNNEMWVDVSTIPDPQEVDRIRKGRFLLQSVGMVPAGLDNAWEWRNCSDLLIPGLTWRRI